MSFAPTYATLPPLFHRPHQFMPVDNPTYIARNEALAAQLKLPRDFFDTTLQSLAGNEPLPDATALTMAYAGHQFGGWNPQLGDGRAALIGEWRGHDLHLKGSGPTAFSRNGDGRAALGPMLREYIVSEAMAALSIPTTRALALVSTGEQVYRQTKEPGAVLTRIAKSHIRVGTFQYAASRQDHDALRALADYEIDRNFTSGMDYQSFLREVIARQAKLIAQWMSVGFIHGVMNTDNMQVAGETIDYGPCAFLDTFHPHKVFSSIDQHGRYRWDHQPTIAQWNLTRFAECLLPLLDSDQDNAVALATAELQTFMPTFEHHFENMMRTKFGITAQEEDGSFIARMLELLMQGEADYTQFFHRLTQLAKGGTEKPVLKCFNNEAIAQETLKLWRNCNPDSALMQNPVIIPRNHRIEEAIQSTNTGDLSPFNRLVAALQHPYTDDPQYEDLQLAPTPEEQVQRTYCGT